MSIFSFVVTPWRSYLENLTIDGKFVNKLVRLSMHQTMCLKRVGNKLLGCHNVIRTSINYI